MTNHELRRRETVRRAAARVGLRLQTRRDGYALLVGARTVADGLSLDDVVRLIREERWVKAEADRLHERYPTVADTWL